MQNRSKFRTLSSYCVVFAFLVVSHLAAAKAERSSAWSTALLRSTTTTVRVADPA